MGKVLNEVEVFIMLTDNDKFILFSGLEKKTEEVKFKALSKHIKVQVQVLNLAK